MINKRLFGAPLSLGVRDKLTERQNEATKAKFGESVKIPKIADVSSRTPFVRMWCAVKLIEPEKVIENSVELKFEEIDGYAEMKELAEKAGHTGANPIKSYYLDANGEFDTGALHEMYPEAAITVTRDKDNFPTKILLKYSNIRDQVDFARKIYMIGDNGYQEKYGTGPNNPSTNPFASVKLTGASTALSKNEKNAVRGEAEKYFTKKGKDNPLMKPHEGITNLTVETEGPMGVIKRTTVNFIVHNMYDFDNIFNKYFLKPGATIFVDYGWNDVKNLYNPLDLIKSKKQLEFLYGEKTKGQLNGIITQNEGDLDVVQGVVTDYNAKALPDGSFECSVTLTSSNSALMNTDQGKGFIARLKLLLTRGVLFFGLSNLVLDAYSKMKDKKQEDYTDADKANIDLLKNIIVKTPDPSSDVQTLEAYNTKLQSVALQKFSSAGELPYGDSVTQGIYIDSLNSDDVYISWGLFEDLVINTQFGHGKDKKDINEGEGFQIRMDSSNSMTRWNKTFTYKQKTSLQSSRIKSYSWMYPQSWIAGYKDANIGSDPKPSYSFKLDKWPKEYYQDRQDIKDYSSAFASWNDGRDLIDMNDKQSILDNHPMHLDYLDKSLEGEGEGVIPLREIFINVENIIDAFEKETDVKKAVRVLLDDINQDSGGLFNWKLRTGVIDSHLEVVDVNFVESEVRDKLLKEENEASRFFVFDVMSPNSIVKDYNLELKLPSGDLANYYAIQAMSHDNSLFSVAPEVKTALNTLTTLDPELVSVVYEPDNGGKRLSQMSAAQNVNQGYDVFNSLKTIIGNETLQSQDTPQGLNSAQSTNISPEGLVNVELQILMDTYGFSRPGGGLKDIGDFTSNANLLTNAGMGQITVGNQMLAQNTYAQAIYESQGTINSVFAGVDDRGAITPAGAALLSIDGEVASQNLSALNEPIIDLNYDFDLQYRMSALTDTIDASGVGYGSYARFEAMSNRFVNTELVSSRLDNNYEYGQGSGIDFSADINHDVSAINNNLLSSKVTMYNQNISDVAVFNPHIDSLVNNVGSVSTAKFETVNDILRSIELDDSNQILKVRETEVVYDDYNVNIDKNLMNKIIEQNELDATFKGMIHTNNTSDYFDAKVFGEKVQPSVSDLMPYYLTLSTYGISSILPGDTFKVNYLPKAYLENSYLQTIKVIQEINSSGWFTTLETQFRTSPENQENILKKSDKRNKKAGGNVRLSSRFIKSLKLKSSISKLFPPKVNIAGSFLGDTKLYSLEQEVFPAEKDAKYEKYIADYLMPFMSNITIDTSWEGNGIVLNFNTTRQGFDNQGRPSGTLGKLHTIWFQSLHLNPIQSAALAGFEDPSFARDEDENPFTQGEYEIQTKFDLDIVYGTSFSDAFIISPRGTVKPSMELLDAFDFVPNGFDSIKDAQEISKEEEEDNSQKIALSNRKIYNEFQAYIFPPSCKWMMNTRYKMLIVEDRYMILNLSTVDSKKINKLLHLFDDPVSRDIPESD